MSIGTDKKRVVIYLRDGLSCLYCGRVLECGIKLTLDHLIPKSQGGSGRYENLVTSCDTCNTRKDNYTLSHFLRHHVNSKEGNHEDIHERIEMSLRRNLKYFNEVSESLLSRYGDSCEVIKRLRRKFIWHKDLESDEEYLLQVVQLIRGRMRCRDVSKNHQSENVGYGEGSNSYARASA